MKILNYPFVFRRTCTLKFFKALYKFAVFMLIIDMKTINGLDSYRKSGEFHYWKGNRSVRIVVLGRQCVLAHFLRTIAKRGQSSVKSGRLLTATLMPFDDS